MRIDGELERLNAKFINIFQRQIVVNIIRLDASKPINAVDSTIYG